MCFKFEYRYYKKYILNGVAGFFISISNEFDTLEYCNLDCNNNILTSSFYKLENSIINNIKEIIDNSRDLFLINSLIYEKNNLDIEQMFYFELENRNRKIEGNSIFKESKLNPSKALLLNVIDMISKELSKNSIVFDLKKCIIK